MPSRWIPPEKYSMDFFSSIPPRDFEMAAIAKSSRSVLRSLYSLSSAVNEVASSTWFDVLVAPGVKPCADAPE